MSIKAMKQAIEAFEDLKKSVTQNGATPEHWDAYYEKQYYALEALRQAIEQAEKQEPVAWLHPDKKVDVVVPTSLTWFDKPLPLYTAPPRKEWVGLTDEEIKNILDCGREGLIDIKKAEQILKDKNT